MRGKSGNPTHMQENRHWDQNGLRIRFADDLGRRMKFLIQSVSLSRLNVERAFFLRIPFAVPSIPIFFEIHFRGWLEPIGKGFLLATCVHRRDDEDVRVEHIKLRFPEKWNSTDPHLNFPVFQFRYHPFSARIDPDKPSSRMIDLSRCDFI